MTYSDASCGVGARVVLVLLLTTEVTVQVSARVMLWEGCDGPGIHKVGDVHPRCILGAALEELVITLSQPPLSHTGHRSSVTTGQQEPGTVLETHNHLEKLGSLFCVLLWKALHLEKGKITNIKLFIALGTKD